MEKSSLTNLTKGSLKFSSSKAMWYYILWCEAIKKYTRSQIKSSCQENLMYFQEIEGLEDVKRQHK